MKIQGQILLDLNPPSEEVGRIVPPYLGSAARCNILGAALISGAILGLDAPGACLGAWVEELTALRAPRQSSVGKWRLPERHNMAGTQYRSCPMNFNIADMQNVCVCLPGAGRGWAAGDRSRGVWGWAGRGLMVYMCGQFLWPRVWKQREESFWNQLYMDNVKIKLQLWIKTERFN